MLKNPTRCLWHWEPDRRSNYFFFSPPAHLCAVTCMTEILLQCNCDVEQPIHLTFKSVWHLQEYGSFHLYSRYVTVFNLRGEFPAAHALCSHAAKRQNPIFRAVSPVSKNLYVKYLIQIHIFLARKISSFGHSAYCRNHYGRFLHSRANYDNYKSPQTISSSFTTQQQKI